MSKKRFFDINLDDQLWFQLLPLKFKCAISTIFRKCDNAGVWPINLRALEFLVGEPINLIEFIDSVNSDKPYRIVFVTPLKLFIPGFIPFQYKKLNPESKPHKQVLELLSEHGIESVPYLKDSSIALQDFSNTILRISYTHKKIFQTSQDKEKDKNRDKDKEKDKEKESEYVSKISESLSQVSDHVTRVIPDGHTPLIATDPLPIDAMKSQDDLSAQYRAMQAKLKANSPEARLP